MKTRKFEKKLALNKKTIAHLSYEELVNLKGGYDNLDEIVWTGSKCGTVCGVFDC